MFHPRFQGRGILTEGTIKPDPSTTSAHHEAWPRAKLEIVLIDALAGLLSYHVADRRGHLGCTVGQYYLISRMHARVQACKDAS